ncbi:hypothetical protein ACIPPQ_20235 [Sphingopyxis sp. LARHCG72]
MAMTSGCTVCSKKLHSQNTSGLCRDHFRTHKSPDVAAKRSKSMRKHYRENPDFLAEKREHMTRINRLPEKRAQASVNAKANRIWEISAEKWTPQKEARRRSGLSRAALPDLPPQYLDLYKSLKRKKLLRPERLRIAREQMAIDRERRRRAFAL